MNKLLIVILFISILTTISNQTIDTTYKESTCPINSIDINDEAKLFSIKNVKDSSSLKTAIQNIYSKAELYYNFNLKYTNDQTQADYIVDMMSINSTKKIETFLNSLE